MVDLRMASAIRKALLGKIEETKIGKAAFLDPLTLIVPNKSDFPVIIILYLLSKFISFFKVKKKKTTSSKTYKKDNIIDAEYEEVE